VDGEPVIFLIQVNGERQHVISVVLIEGAGNVSCGTLSIVSRWHSEKDLYGDIPGVTQYDLGKSTDAFGDLFKKRTFEEGEGYWGVEADTLKTFISKIATNKIGVIPKTSE